METKNEIKLVQTPIIIHELAIVGKSVTERLKVLNLENQVATEETVKSLKELRSELNKELADFEVQRKFIKEGVNKPYNDFEAIYKSEISEKYTTAINLLKDKIASVENKIKTEKKVNILAYFNELCASEKIDFVSFETVVPEILLSTTEKAYKTQCNDFIMKVVDDLNFIKSTEFENEVLVEYKKTLNASKAFTEVSKRKEDEKIEAEKSHRIAINNRKSALLKEGFVFVEFTKTFQFGSHEIIITDKEVNELSKEEFTQRFIELSEQIKNYKANQQSKKAKTDTEVPVIAPLEAPKVEVKEKLVEAEFRVTGTMSQLMALKEFLISNQITYINI
jgi:hypothetical protein